MRRSEITPKLIELSKSAKELGFPQDAEEGEWYISDRVNELVQWGSHPTNFNDNQHLCVILSFSRCLEWFVSRSKGEMIGLDLNNFIHGYWILAIKTKSYRGENIHEAIAKAVVKILEKN